MFFYGYGHRYRAMVSVWRKMPVVHRRRLEKLAQSGERIQNRKVAFLLHEYLRLKRRDHAPAVIWSMAGFLAFGTIPLLAEAIGLGHLWLTMGGVTAFATLPTAFVLLNLRLAHRYRRTAEANGWTW